MGQTPTDSPHRWRAIDTELLREEITTRYGEGLSIDQALRRQRGSRALLLMLPPW